MEFKLSALQADVDYVLAGNDPLRVNNYEARLRVGSEYIDAIKVIQRDTVEAFSSTSGPGIVLTAVFGAGQYAKQIYPNRRDLEMTVFRSHPGKVLSALLYEDQADQRDTYRAVLMSEGNPMVDNEKIAAISQDTLDISDVVEVSFQLFIRSQDDIRKRTISRSYRHTTTGNLLNTLLNTVIESVEYEGEDKVTGVEMVPPDSETVHEQIVIPDWVQVLDLPGYLQEHAQGIYNSGIGSYIRGDTWYIFPLYNTKRVEQSERMLDITMVPENQLPGVIRTSRVVGDMTMILVTGPRQVLENSTKEQEEKGTGARFAEAKGFMDRFTSMGEEGKVIVDRTTTVNEFVSETRDPGQTFAKISANPISSNTLKVSSELAKRAGSYFSCIWEWADPSRIYPGMLARVKYLDGDTVRSFEGSLHSCYVSDQLYGKGMAENRYMTLIHMTFFVERDIDMEA